MFITVCKILNVFYFLNLFLQTYNNVLFVSIMKIIKGSEVTY